MKDPIRITTATRIWRDFRRRLTRNEWAIRLLGLSRSPDRSTDPGLILVQIDGLSRHQLERALQQNRMPFLRSLLDAEQYVNHILYSGLPASTAAVQAELFYGVPAVIPAFGFRDHRTGALVRMNASEVARDVETRLRRVRPGLLEGGSSYGNVFSGGASAEHYCATSIGWSEFLGTVNPLKLVIVMLLNILMFLRVTGLMMVELVLALLDWLRGIVPFRQFLQQLRMIPARVIVVVLLRDLVTVGASYDSARGEPVIHVNFLGYDEQAHRCGPDSRMAGWALRGIDRAVRRIWKSAHQGAGREYDVWVFSDHGQQAARPWQGEHGELLQQQVARTVDAFCSDSGSLPVPGQPARLLTRARWLGIRWLASIVAGEQDQDALFGSPHVQTATSGSLAFVYLLADSARRHADEIARRLATEAQVPMVVQAIADNAARVTTADGIYRLPQDAIQVFGSEHPFLDEVANDLVRLAHHPDAGDLLLAGWSHDGPSTSFVWEYGAHGGPGIEETRAFALLPPDAPVPESGKRYLRPNDLRRAALACLGRDPRQTPRRWVREEAGDQRIRLVTYNVHACVGMDGQLIPGRIARVIAQSGADIACLQELDVFRRRSGNDDQARRIARSLEMNFQFHPAWHLQKEQFGNAILTRFPMNIVQAEGLHHHKADRSRRSALWVEIKIDDQMSVQVINTHMSIYPREQLIQARQLLNEWVQPARQRGPVILCGDFNARPKSATWKVFADSMIDVESLHARRHRSTYFSPFPITRLDHMFVTPDLEPKQVQVIRTRMARDASDHLPLYVELQLKRDQPDAPAANAPATRIQTSET